VAHGISFRLLERFRIGLLSTGTGNVESRLAAAVIRVASKGVYAGGGSIAELLRARNTTWCRASGCRHCQKTPPSFATAGE